MASNYANCSRKRKSKEFSQWLKRGVATLYSDLTRRRKAIWALTPKSKPGLTLALSAHSKCKPLVLAATAHFHWLGVMVSPVVGHLSNIPVFLKYFVFVLNLCIY